jgi:hypothetical protein
MGEEAVLADSGLVGAIIAGVGRVRKLRAKGDCLVRPQGGRYEDLRSLRQENILGLSFLSHSSLQP